MFFLHQIEIGTGFFEMSITKPKEMELMGHCESGICWNRKVTGFCLNFGQA